MPSARSTKATVPRAVFPAVGKSTARARFSYGLNSVVQPDMHPLLSMLAPHSKDIKKKRGSRGCFMTAQSQYLEILSAYRAPAGNAHCNFTGNIPVQAGALAFRLRNHRRSACVHLFAHLYIKRQTAKQRDPILGAHLRTAARAEDRRYMAAMAA